MNGSGWIKLYRQVKHSSIWKSPIQFQIWMAILLSVELDGTIHANNKKDLLKKLGINCNYHTFYDTMRKLENEDMITIEIGNGIIIKVNNWEKYQMTENALQSESPKQVQNESKTSPKLDTIEEDNQNLNSLLVDNSSPKQVQNESQTSPKLLSEEPTGNVGSLEAKEIINNNKYINISKDILKQSFENSFSNNLKEKDFPTPPHSANPPSPTEKGKKKRGKKESELPEELEDTLKEEQKDIGKKEVLSLIGKFCDTMGYPFNKDTIAKNYKFAKELLQTYTEEEIIMAVKQGIEIYKREGKKTPAMFIPTLASVKNMIHVWITEAKKKEVKSKYEF